MARKRKVRPSSRKIRSARISTRRFPMWARIVVGVVALGIAILLLLLLLNRSENQISITENAIGSFFTPVQSAVSNATRSVRDFLEDWHKYDTLKDEYDELTQENIRLTLELDSAEESLQENARLRELLSANSNYETLDPIYGRVIARESGQWFTTFSVNRGQSSGIATGMAVVNGSGLIGRVFEVGLNYSKVLTIIDPRSSLSCLVQRTRDNGIMTGGITDTDDIASCYINYLPNLNNITPGDAVVTSGTDQIFPKGLYIGTVSQVSLNAGYEGNYAVVAPSVDFNHIEEVLILRDYVETESSENTVNLPTLPPPTPAPSATPSPVPSGKATPAPDEIDDTFVMPDANGNGKTVYETLPEDIWVEN